MAAEPLSHPGDPGGAATPPIPPESVCQSVPSPQPRPRVTGGSTGVAAAAAVQQTPPTRPAAAARTRAVRLFPEKGPGSEERRRENLPGGHSPGSVRGAPSARFCSEGGNRGRTYVSALAAGWTKCALGMRGWVLRLGPKLHSTAPLGNKDDCGPQRLHFPKLRFEEGNGA